MDDDDDDENERDVCELLFSGQGKKARRVNVPPKSIMYVLLYFFMML